MGFFRKLFGSNKSSKTEQTKNTSDISVRNISLQSEQSVLTVHPDIRSLLWIGDGKFKNYIPAPLKKSTFVANGISLTISFSEDDEPSLLFLNLPISNTTKEIERPPYYPTYKGLTPEQRGAYWRLLADPYNNTIDIGYVFILYYGLERYLLTDRYEEAINVILKLRDVQPNKSFQMYTANAIILTCLARQRADIVQVFLDSLDKEHEFHFSPNLYLLCKYALGLPLLATDIMRMAKSFEFTKSNYINKYPDLFIKALTLHIIEQFNSDSIPWNKILSNTDFKKLPVEKTPVFANMSIWDRTIQVPLIVDSFKLKKNMYDLLDKAHETVKYKLSEMRKDGSIPQQNNTPNSNASSKETLTFNKAEEEKLINVYNKKSNNLIDQHFISIALQDLYYKYRNLDSIYLDKCIEYCQDDISKLNEMQKQYVEDEQRKILSSPLLSPLEREQKLSKVDLFRGSIPAFKRLAIIYEKNKDYEKAISICNQAISYYSSLNMQTMISEFEERQNKLINKKNALNT